MADLPTELTPQIQIVDLQTAQASKDLLQKLNAIIRVLRDHEIRLEDLEP